MKDSCSKRKHIILHVDMDHFYSAVEERENPEFRGKPVVVGANPKGGNGRGVVKTCNYKARSFGLHSGMPISRAWKLCSKAIYVQGNHGLYRQVSKEIMAILGKYSNQLQQWGLDEAFLDVSGQVQDFREAAELATCIKHEILWKEKLSCSIGVAPNKLVAKIASEYEKPDGLTVVTEDEVEKFLAPLPVRKMLWIGEVTERRLNKMEIKTIGDLAASNISELAKRLGVMGARYHRWARGKYDSEVASGKARWKSVGHESTFADDVEDDIVVFKRINDLCLKVHERIVKHNLFFKTVTVKKRLIDFETCTRGRTLPYFTNNVHALTKTAKQLARYCFAGKKKTRLVGVRVSNLTSSKGQTTLS